MIAWREKVPSGHYLECFVDAAAGETNERRGDWQKWDHFCGGRGDEHDGNAPNDECHEQTCWSTFCERLSDLDKEGSSDGTAHTDKLNMTLFKGSDGFTVGRRRCDGTDFAKRVFRSGTFFDVIWMFWGDSSYSGTESSMTSVIPGYEKVPTGEKFFYEWIPLWWIWFILMVKADECSLY